MVAKLVAAFAGFVLAGTPVLNVCAAASSTEACHTCCPETLTTPTPADCCVASAPESPRTARPPVAVPPVLTPTLVVDVPWTQPLHAAPLTPPDAAGTPPVPILLQTTVLLV